MATSVEARQRASVNYREKNRERLRAIEAKRRSALKDEVLARYGLCCARCGFDNKMALCIDHVDNNGSEERRALGGQNMAGWNFYRTLKSRGWPDGYQTLCANCNLIKQMELVKN